MFHPGQLILCVDDSHWTRRRGPITVGGPVPLQRGRIYTVRRFIERATHALTKPERKRLRTLLARAKAARDRVVADFRVVDHGTVIAFVPLTEAAETFVADHVAIPAYAGSPTRFYADHRPARDLTAALAAEGFTITEED